jgi:Ca2+-binding RTX toxin-like protein
MTEAAPGPENRLPDRANNGITGSGVVVAALASAGNVVADVILIDRPAPGQMKIVETAAARLLKFSFDLSNCKITVLDVDAILVFPDGGKIVMPNFALQMLVASPPVIQFDAITVEPHVLLARAGDIKLLDQIPEFALSDTARPDSKTETPQPTAQIVQVTATQQYGHTPGPQSRPFVIDGTGTGSSLSETNGRYAKRVENEESQGSSLKGEGALTENSQQTVTTDSNTNPTTDVNNAKPIITSPATFSHAENTALITILTATDTDTGSVLTFAVVGGADAEKFSVNSATGKLYFVDNPDFEGLGSHDGSNTYQVIVAVSDGIDSTTQSLTITLDNINEAPDSISFSAAGVDEGTATGTVVGSVTGHDPDVGSQLSYTFAPGGDAGGRFTVDGSTGIISVLRGDLIDFEASQSQLIVVRATDQDGLSFDRAIVISVNDTNDAPVITSNGGGSSAAITISEGMTGLTTVTATDTDAGSVVSYAIIGGSDAGRFAINSVTGTLSFITSIDFEVPGDANGDNIYNVVVQASDSRGGTDQQALAIAVVNANDPPQNLVLSANTVAENAAIGTLVGVFQATDPDANSTLTYSFVPGGDAAGQFAIDAVTGQLSVLDGTRLDFESSQIQTIIVRATDQGGLSTDRAFIIQLTDVNEAPLIISDGGAGIAAFSVSEGSMLATRVSAFDPENAQLVYSITGGVDASRFTINGATGVLTFIVSPDFEAPGDADADNIYRLTVQVSDGALTDTQSLSITVTDTGEAPIIISNGGGAFAAVTLLEGTTFATAVTASDPDAGSILSYGIIGGVDASRFAINSSTGTLSLVVPPDFENPNDADGNNIYDVVVQVSDGLLTDTQSIQVTVINQNDAPVIVSDGGNETSTVAAGENSAFVTTVSAVDPDVGSVLIYTISGGVDASRFTINANTGTLMFIAAPDFEAPTDVGNDNIYDVQIQVLDGVGGVDTQAIAVTVTNQNEAPVIVSNGGGPTAAFAVQENTTAVSAVIAMDPDAGAVLTYSISGGADAAKFVINTTTGVLAFISSPDFDIAGDADGNNIYDVTVQVSDGLGGIDQQAIAVTVSNQNETPSITSNGGGATASVTVQENGTAVTTVTASDPDASTTLFYTIVGGVDASKFTINPANGLLTFLIGPDFETPGDVGGNNIYDIVVQVSDGLGGTDTQTIAVTVVNQNEAPVITSNGGGATAVTSVAENSTAVTTVTATDVDVGATRSFSITGGADAALFTVNASTGVLAFLSGRNFEVPGDVGANNVYDVTVQVSDGLGGIDTQAIAVTITNINEAPVITSNGGGATASVSRVENSTAVTTVTSTDPDAGATKTFSIIGGLDASRFTINPTTGVLTFLTAPNFEVPTDNGLNNIYDVTVQVSDSLGGIDTQAIAVTVTNQNEAPDITSNGGAATAALSISENGAAVTTITAIDADAGAVLTYSISGGADAAKFAINATTGVLTFIAAPDFDIPTDAGANNVYDVTVQVSDGLGGTDTQAIAVTITNINEAPVITSNGGGATASVSLAENNTTVTTVTSTDPDAGATKTFSIIGGVDASRFTINPTTGVLTFVTPPDFELPTDIGLNNIYDVTVEVSDSLGGIDTQAIAVTITNANETPSITSNGGAATAAISMVENATAVTTVTATDVDVGAVLTYSISGGADAAQFVINASTGVLTFITTPDFDVPGDAGANNVYDITVQVSDGLGGTDTQAIAITITDLNDVTPTITSNGGGPAAAITVAENTMAVTTVVAIDPDTTGVVTYSIAGGVDAAKFSINAATGVLTFISSQNFETPADAGGNNIYDVVVRASDGLNTDDQSIAVTVTNQNEAPAITSNGGAATAAVNMAENGTAVTTVTATDPDAAAVLTYSISGGADAARFAINATTGALTFIATPDFETKTDNGSDGIYDITVEVSDGLGGTDTQAIAVTIADVNEAPVITSNGGTATAALSIAENATAVTTVTASDPDAGAVVSFSIIGGADAALFSINATTGLLSFVAGRDFESATDADANGIYEVIVQASDGLGGADTQVISVSLTNVNEAPVITSNGGGGSASVAVAENTLAVTTVTATDVDAGTTLSFSIIGGDDAGLFTINPTTGALTFIAAPDFDVPGNAGGDNIYDVRVQVSDGALIDTQSIKVTVTNVNDIAPVITSDGSGSGASVLIGENASAVTTVVATDADLIGTVTYSISGGADAARFAINANTGVLTFVAAPDFEAPTDAGGNNIYDVVVEASDGSLTDIQAIAVQVSDVNETPVITSDGGAATANISILENATSVTTVVAADPDAPTSIVYFIQGGADQSLFSINATTGVLSFISAPDFEAPADLGGNNIYDVIVRASDGILYDDQAIAVTLTNQTGAFTGTAGTDAYAGSGEEDLITGLAGNDTLSGGLGNDTIDGGSDNDNIYGGAGADSLEGGTGVDNLRYDSDTVGVSVNLVASTASGTGSEADGDIISGFEGVVGGSGADSLTGDGGGNFLRGNDGNDTISGRAGDDTIFGGMGADVLAGGIDNDWLSYADDTAGVNVSLLTGAASGGEAQGDTISGFESLQGGSGSDTLSGDNLGNVVLGHFGADTLYGLGGNDTLSGDSTSENGLDGADSLEGGAGDDSLSGMGDDDQLVGGNGNDTIDGGTGADTVSFSGNRADYTVTTAFGITTVTDNRDGAPDGVDRVTNVETFYFVDGSINLSDVNDQILTLAADGPYSGGAVADVIRGLGGNDTLSGSDGNDRLEGGADSDLLSGGNSNDTIAGDDNLLVNGSFERLSVTFGSSAVLSSISGWTAIPGGQIEIWNNIGTVHASDGGQNLELDYAGDHDGLYQDVSTTFGTSYALTLETMARPLAGGVTCSFEVLWNGVVIDTVTPMDTGFWQGLSYTVVGTGSLDRLTIQELAVNGTDGLGAMIDNISLTTTAGGDDLLFGGSGDDLLQGGGGDDWLQGGTGDDTLNGGIGYDTADYGDATTGVAVSLATQAQPQATGDSGTDQLSGIEALVGSGFNDTLIGNGGDNRIFGGAGDDSVNGGTGNDTIDAEAGNDTLDGSGSDVIGLFGGSGNDLLILDTAALEQAGTAGSGGADYDTVMLRDNGSSNPVLEVGLDLVGKLDGIEKIDCTGASVKVDFGNSTAADIRSILGLSGPAGSGTLTLDFDGNDSFSVAGGEFFTQVANLTTFYSDAGLTNEIARVSVI